MSVVHEGKRISCNYIGCNKTFTNTNAMKSHKWKHTDTPSKMCHICCKHFSHKSRLDQHLRSHETSKQFECPKCDKKYSQKYELNRHAKTCGQKFECAECGKLLANKNNLKEHLKYKHSNSDTYTCTMCPERPTFKYRSSSNNPHNRKHNSLF